MISIIDCKLGNIGSLVNKISLITNDYQVTNNLQLIAQSSCIFLPGVGNAGYAMSELNKILDTNYLKNIIIHQKKPIMGICVGAQIMGSLCEEGNCNGLGFFNFETIKIPHNSKFSLPHVGWNYLNIKKKSFLLDSITKDKRFYFTHSYFMKPKKKDEDILATTDYSLEIPAILNKENIFSVQFHPEKSYDQGIKLINNFITKYN